MPANVLGSELESCCENPITGFFRDGYCKTCAEDLGMHTVCVIVTDDFLEFSFSQGNDLITPIPEYAFPGLKSGDKWCLCLPRWLEALEMNQAPQVYLKGTHISAIEHISLDILKKYAIDIEEPNL